MAALSFEEFTAKKGEKVGSSGWFDVGQDRINDFADCTEDHQFIHVNPEMAKMTPLGGTIAHGLLTLSMMPKMTYDALPNMKGVKMGMNYGYDKIRFLSPVPSGSKVRGHFTLKDIVEKRPGQYLMTYGCEVEIEGSDKPALVCDWLSMQFAG